MMSEFQKILPLDLNVNYLPAFTMEHLDVNKARLSFNIRPTMPNTQEELPPTVKCLEANDAIFSDFPMITTGMGKELSAWLSMREHNITRGYIAQDGSRKWVSQISLIGTGVERQYIYVKAGADATFIITYNGDGTLLLQTKVFVEEGASFHLVKLDTMQKGGHLICDTGIKALEGSSVQFTQIKIGAARMSTGLNVDLVGNKSSLDAALAFYAQKRENLDINYIVNHYGRDTHSNYVCYGAIGENTKKVFRGTIDFKQGSSGSTGHEKEEILLLNDNVCNKSVPLILCKEEDVEGQHGASIGHISDNVLFYMATRGISKEELERILVKSRIDKVARRFSSLCNRTFKI